jgi:hypothetical protein
VAPPAGEWPTLRNVQADFLDSLEWYYYTDIKYCYYLFNKRHKPAIFKSRAQILPLFLSNCVDGSDLNAPLEALFSPFSNFGGGNIVK